MTFQHPDIVINTMWSDVEEAEEECGVFAILDAAADPSIFDDVLRTGIKYRCLYTGEIPEALAEVAPYLLQLDREDPATRLLIHNCWGKSWGIFFTSTAYLEGIHRHFRRFLKVRDEDGNSLYFRYYDPRVWRAYLPTCDRSELLFVFGPVRKFFVEDEDPDKLLEFVIRDEKFITLRRPVVPAAEPDPLPLPLPELVPEPEPGPDLAPEPEPGPEPEPEPEPVSEPDPVPEPEPKADPVPKLDLPPVVHLAPESAPSPPPAIPPLVVLPPPVEAEDLAPETSRDPASDPARLPPSRDALPAAGDPAGEAMSRAAQLADMPIGDGEETLVSGLDEVATTERPAGAPAVQQGPPPDARQALMDMPLGDGLGEETLLVPTEELLGPSPGGEDHGEPEDPESR